MKGEQLALSVQLHEFPGLDNFFAGPNAAVLAAVRTLAGPGTDRDLLIFGPPAAGKSHLLQGACRQVQQHEGTASYLPLKSLRSVGPEALQGHEAASLLCLDDVDSVAAEEAWALPLLRLIDERRARHAALLMASAAPAERIHCALPDLRTRLAASASLGLRPLTDAHRLQLLQASAQNRGLELSEDAARWMLHRLPRDAGRLLAALEHLDRASLSAKRRLSLPFVQQQLAPDAPEPETARTSPD